MRFIVSRDYSPYGRVFLISKLKVGIGAAVLILATAAITATVVSKWNPFPPQDYEDCAAGAARDAKSKDALSVLLSICGSEFNARRKPGGGYAYYDSCQDRTVDVKGPNPTPAELNNIKQQCSIYIEAQEQIETEQARRAAELAEQKRRAKQAAQEARNMQLQAAQEARAAAEQQRQLRKASAMTDIYVRPAGFECWIPRWDSPTNSMACDRDEMKVEVTNRSREALSGVSIGLAFVPMKSACPSSYAEKHSLSLKLSPGEMRTDIIYDIDPAFSKLRVCIAVVDLQLAGESPLRRGRPAGGAVSMLVGGSIRLAPVW
jgi:hypothetical protein